MMDRNKFRAILFHNLRFAQKSGVWYCQNDRYMTLGKTKSEAHQKMNKIVRRSWKAGSKNLREYLWGKHGRFKLTSIFDIS